MMKQTRKSAFSIAESLVSLMIMTLAVMLTMTTITNKKIKHTRNNSKTGIYACWVSSSGNIVQRQFNGTTEDLSQRRENPSDGCIFQPKRDMFEFYVFAFGKREGCVNNKCFDGEFYKKSITPKGFMFDNGVHIGFEGNDKNTLTIYNLEEGTNNNQNTVSISGSLDYNDAGLIPDNIEMCKYYADDTDISNNDNCKCKVGNNNIKLICDSGEYSASLDNQDNVVNDSGDVVKKDSDNSDIYRVKFSKRSEDNDTIEKTFKVKIMEKNPLRKGVRKKLDDSEFTIFLKMLSAKRRNNILIRDLYSGSTRPNLQKGGIVIIVW